MKKNQVKNKVLNKYNCISKNNTELQKFFMNTAMFIARKEYAKNNVDHMYNMVIVDKLCKNLMRGGNSYPVKKRIFLAFKFFKNYVRIHPLFVYFYLIFFFLILIEFKKVRKSGVYYRVPKAISEEEISILRTVKLFTDTIKYRLDKGTDLETKIFSELFALAFFVKRSKFYSASLTEYYSDIEANMKHMNYRW